MAVEQRRRRVPQQTGAVVVAAVLGALEVMELLETAKADSLNKQHRSAVSEAVEAAALLTEAAVLPSTAGLVVVELPARALSAGLVDSLFGVAVVAAARAESPRETRKQRERPEDQQESQLIT
jgi:hypothetical protein